MPEHCQIFLRACKSVGQDRENRQVRIDFPYPKEIYLALLYGLYLFETYKIPALASFAECFLKAQLVSFNLKILYKSQKYIGESC